jgi:CheY-like chemotaxis protein
MANQRFKILVVEDEEGLRLALAELLELDGFEVFMARDGEDGYRQALMSEPDLIITDLVMPVLDGLELAQLIRRQAGRIRAVPIIALSANLTNYNLTSRMNSGINRFLSKPISDYRGLASTIRSLLEQGEQQLSAISVSRQ